WILPSQPASAPPLPAPAVQPLLFSRMVGLPVALSSAIPYRMKSSDWFWALPLLPTQMGPPPCVLLKMSVTEPIPQVVSNPAELPKVTPVFSVVNALNLISSTSPALGWDVRVMPAALADIAPKSAMEATAARLKLRVIAISITRTSNEFYRVASAALF